jgi:hypothetical protein
MKNTSKEFYEEIDNLISTIHSICDDGEKRNYARLAGHLHGILRSLPFSKENCDFIQKEQKLVVNYINNHLRPSNN